MKVELPDEFIKKITRLGDKTDSIIEKSLVAGADVVLPKVKSNLQSVVGRGTKYPSKSTGELAGSIGKSSVRLDKKGNYDIKIGFNEPRRGKGGSNAKLANILEHGKHGQPPKPFLKPARSATRKQCIESIKSALEEEMNKV